MNKTVLLIADTCDDIYHMGHVTRMNPEAPVPVFVEDHQKFYSGMGYNVKENLTFLGLDVVNSLSMPSQKHRYVDIRSKYQLIRVDQDVDNDPLQISDILDALAFVDAVVISDYNKGFIDYDLIMNINRICYNLRTPVFIDTKKTCIAEFSNCIIKINESEYYNALKYSDRTGYGNDLIVTLGEKGARYKNTIYATDKHVEVHDVTGAGDTFLAALVYKYLETESIEESIPFANKAASITVQKFGTYAPSLKEILNA